MQLPNWMLSGLLALLLGLYAANYVRGQYHGADQPQHPETGDFITEDEDFWRWVISGLAVAAITAYAVPRLAPAINGLIQSTSLMAKVGIGIWGVIILRSAYEQLG